MPQPSLTAEDLIAWNDRTSQEWRKLLTEHPEVLALPCDIAGADAVNKLLRHIVAVELRYAQQLSGQPLTEHADVPSDSAESLYATHDRATAIFRDLLSKPIDWDERRKWERYWLVDPLDGTREFVKRNGEFTVNIALIENNAPVLGVVLLPVTGALYYGVVGEGAFLESAPGALPQPIATRAAGAVPVVAGSRSHSNERQAAMLGNLGDHRLVSVGSSIKFCMVARGEADLYLRLGATSEWDTAAAQCVVEQAGGAVTDLHGQPFRYNTKASLINPEFLAAGDPSVDWLARLQAS